MPTQGGRLCCLLQFRRGFELCEWTPTAVARQSDPGSIPDPVGHDDRRATHRARPPAIRYPRKASKGILCRFSDARYRGGIRIRPVLWEFKPVAPATRAVCNPSRPGGRNTPDRKLPPLPVSHQSSGNPTRVPSLLLGETNPRRFSRLDTGGGPLPPVRRALPIPQYFRFGRETHPPFRVAEDRLDFTCKSQIPTAARIARLTNRRGAKTGVPKRKFSR